MQLLLPRATPLLLLLLLAARASVVSSTAIVEHSFDGLTFSKIGDITLEDEEKGGAAIVTATYERYPITDAQLQQLKDLVEADGLYVHRVRLPDQPAVITSLKAACLAEHLLSHELSLAITEAGQLIGSQLSVPQADAGCSAAKALQALQQLPRDALLQPRQQQVTVRPPAAAPAVPQGPAGAEIPDIKAAGAVPNPAAAAQAAQQAASRQQGAAGASGQQGGEGGKEPPPPDTRTWWQKNWLYVMAGGTMVLNLALKASGVADAAPGGQPGAAAGRGASRVPAV